jgi:predicted TIM-barrel fold metal-dependent hydrolase
MTTPVLRPAIVDAHVHLWDLAVRPQPWTEDLPPLRRSVIEHVVAAFGPDRAMAGSDWPVCLLAADYGSVMTTLTRALDRLRPPERESVRGGTAVRWYSLSGVGDAIGQNGSGS